jgi:L-ascorbate metabolism protein UlaG (beta-lactamase superfamily)
VYRTVARLFSAVAGALLIGSQPSTGSAGETGVTVTFLANDGVLLSSGAQQVLIDGLFLKYETGYAVPADSTRQALARAQPPFDGVDLILVTHRHGDHFHPQPIAEHLAANPAATLVASSQVMDSLRGRASSVALGGDRLLARTMPPLTRRTETIGGIAVELLGLPHGGRRHRGVEHLGFIVELGGRRVLHVGDADFSEGTFAPFRLDTARIDVALLPYWMVTSPEGQRVIARWIRPRQVVAIHIPEDGVDAVREVRSAMPGATVFDRSLETHNW